MNARRKIRAGTKAGKIKRAAAPAVESTQEQDEILSAWRAELELFEGRRFASLPKARNALVAAVVARLKIPDAMRGKMTEFLNLALEDDPEVDQILDQYVKS